MIDINLTNSPAYIVGRYSSGKARKTAGIIFIVLLLAAIPVAAVFLAREYFAEYEELQEVKVERVVRVRASSRTVNERIIEDIIDSVGAVRENTAVDRRFEEMARFEQLNYEVKFTALALEEFKRITPKTITFGELRINNYRNLKAAGTAPDRETVSRLLSQMRTRETWDLMPRPYTNISDGGTFYSFRIEANYLPSMASLRNNPIDPRNIPDIRHLDQVQRRIVAAARSANLRTQGLTLVHSINEPHKREFRYTISLGGNFPQILNFVEAVANMPEAVRIENLTLRYRPRTIEATATIVIGVR